MVHHRRYQARSTAVVDLTKAALLKALACTTLGNVYVFIEFNKQFVSIVKNKNKIKEEKKEKSSKRNYALSAETETACVSD